MIGKLVSLTSLLGLALVAAAALRSDVAAQIEPVTDDPPLPASEPITGSPAVALAGDEQPQKDPFEPYDPGDPDAIIALEELSADEQAAAIRGLDVAPWRGIHDSYATAVAQRSKQARAEAAAHVLGVDDLASIGVVP